MAMLRMVMKKRFTMMMIMMIILMREIMMMIKDMTMMMMAALPEASGVPCGRAVSFFVTSRCAAGWWRPPRSA